MNRRTGTRLLVSCGVASLMLTGPARAAAAAPGEGTETGEGNEAIVVTGALTDPVEAPVTIGVLGTRTPLEIPFSVSTFSADRIANQQANTLQEALRNEPALNGGIGAAGFASFPNFRGYRTSLLFDGLPLNDILNTGNSNLFGFERIDVLKGASAFLYSATASPQVGGSINHIPKSPLTDPLTAITLSFFEPGYVEGSLDVSRKVGANDAIGIRFAGLYGKGDTAVDLTSDERITANLSLSYEAADLRLLAVAGYDKVRNNVFREGIGLDDGVDVPKPPSNDSNLNQPWSFIEAESLYGYVRADWDFAENWSLSAQAALTDTKNPGLSSFGSITATNGDVLLFPYAFYIRDSALKNSVVQLTVRGSFETGPLKHELVISGAHFRGSIAGDFPGVTFPDGSDSFESNLYHPVATPRPIVGTAPTTVSRRNFSESVSFSDIISLGKFSLLAGVRYVELGTKRYNQATGALTRNSRQHATTPIGSVMFKPSEASLLYFTYAEGFEQGGTAPVDAANAREQLSPARTKQLEIGGKLNVGRLLFTAAAFDMKRAFDYLHPETKIFGHLGTQRHRGVELQVIGAVTKELTISAGTMILDPKLEDTGSSATEGKRPSGVPKFTMPIYVDYAPSFAPGLHVNTAVTHFGRQAYDETNKRHIKAWTRWDLGARYEFGLGGADLTARINVENVLAKDYWQSVLFGTIFPGSPRTVKLSVTAKL